MAPNIFFKEIDKINHHRWKIGGTILLFLALFITFSLIGSRNRTPEEIEKTINESDGLKRVNQLCAELPKPDKTKFFYKSIEGNTFTYAVSYNYKTERPFKEIETFYSA